jgi:hypothetical protein
MRAMLCHRASRPACGDKSSRHIGRRSKREIMNYSELNGWTVEVTYRNGSSPATFTIEELEDIERHVDLRSDWVAISINRCVSKPPSEPEFSAALSPILGRRREDPCG